MFGIQQLKEQGWSKASIRKYIEYIYVKVRKNNYADQKLFQRWFLETQIVGSKIFGEMWKVWKVDSVNEARQKIQVLMRVVEMQELGDPILDDGRQKRQILRHFYKRLAPHDPFWHSLAKLVQSAFPKGLMEEFELARMVHQFRYVIDAQQVRYVRDRYELAAGNDEKKLAVYLRQTHGDWSLMESDRLHQKCNKAGIYPDGSRGTNIKVTVNRKFHSEFILDQEGHFLYILDEIEKPEIRKNSILNGASFNYADYNDIRLGARSVHMLLDVLPVTLNDPFFRKEANSKRDPYRVPDRQQYMDPGFFDGRQSIKSRSDQRKREFEKGMFL